jgi:hypothetical protein
LFLEFDDAFLQASNLGWRQSRLTAVRADSAHRLLRHQLQQRINVCIDGPQRSI